MRQLHKHDWCMSGRQIVLCFPRVAMNALQMGDAISQAMPLGTTPELVVRLGWDPKHSFGIDPRDYDDPSLPWLKPETLGLSRSEDDGYGRVGDPIAVDKVDRMLAKLGPLVGERGFAGAALVWRWRPGQAELFPDLNPDPAYFQWNIWPEDCANVGVEVIIDFPSSSVPSTSPFGKWITGFVAECMRALGVKMCAQAINRGGSYGPLDEDSVLSSLHMVETFGASRLLAVSTDLMSPSEMRGLLSRSRDAAVVPRVSLVEAHHLLVLLPTWFG